MGVVSVTEIWDGRGMSYSDGFHREYRRTFRVVCDTLLITQTYILFSPYLPKLGSIYVVPGYESDVGALCTGVHADQDNDDPFVWIVKVEYSTRPPVEFKRKEFTDTTQPGNAPDPDPLRQRPDIRWGTVHDRVVAEYSEAALVGGPAIVDNTDGDVGSENLDLLINPVEFNTVPRRRIVNTAGQPYYPRLEKDASRTEATITRNEKTFPTDLLKLRDHVNENRFLGYAARQVKLRSITGDRMFEHNVSFHRVQYVFEMREPSWDVIVAQYGTMARPAALEAAKPIIVGGVPVSTPQRLDAFGFDQTNSTFTLREGEVFYVKHALYKAVDFQAILNFGDLT